jgi:hypothetical protein
VAYEAPPRETVGVFLDELHARGSVAHFRCPVAPPATERVGS